MDQEITEVAPELYPFSNPLEKDVTIKWGGIAYTFKARTRTPLLGKIPGANPEEVENIRKKFATDLATIAYYDSESYKKREISAPTGSGLTPALYTESDLAPFIQACLEPLPISIPTTEVVKEDLTAKMEKTARARGRPKSRVLQGNEDLIKEALGADGVV